MKHFLICLPLALLAPVILLAQQNITVSGVIFDEYGMPLPGATVIEVGTVNGVSTDFDGNYTIEVLEGATLEYSYVGYQAQTALANTPNPINISLMPANELEEVVVVAYGTQSKQSIVGSVAVISESDIQGQPATTITQAIQGSVPGSMSSIPEEFQNQPHHQDQRGRIDKCLCCTANHCRWCSI